MSGGFVASGAGDDDVPHLDATRQRLGLSMEELWVFYIGLGGRWSLADFTGYLAGSANEGALEHRVGEHKVVAQAIGERFMGDTPPPPPAE